MKMRNTILATVVGSFAFVGASAAEAETIPERLINDLQEDFGFEDFQAAGITGNLARETGNFRYLQEMNPLVEGSRGGIGYSQWTGPRRVAFEDWAGDRDLNSYEVNYGYLVEELTGQYARVVDKVLATESAEEAANVFMSRYLIPHPSYQHLDERVSYAEAYLAGDFSGAGCQSFHEVETSGRMIVVSMCPEPADLTDDSMTTSLGLADIDDLRPEGLDEDIAVVLADLLRQGSPLASAREDLRYDMTEVEDPFDMTDISYNMSVEESSRDVIYGLLEVD
jgi:hypothetical protein